MTGYDVTLGVVDEGWDVSPECVADGLEPAMENRLSPQLHLTSTAHRRRTSLMPRRIESALRAMDLGETGDDTLLMIWAMPPEADIGDEATWRAASPYWSEHRHKLIRGKYERAMSGEADPEADDPDPIEGFKCQYLNAWPAPKTRPVAGEPVVTAEEWEGLNGYHRNGSAVAVAAVEAWFVDGVSVATGESLPDGRVGVSVRQFADLPAAAAYLSTLGPVTILAGKSIANDPLLAGAAPVGATSRQAMLDLRRAIDDDVLAHDGSDVLTGQVLELRTVPSTDGPRLVSKGRCDAVKAAVWAVERARHGVDVPMIF